MANQQILNHRNAEPSGDDGAEDSEDQAVDVFELGFKRVLTKKTPRGPILGCSYLFNLNGSCHSITEGTVKNVIDNIFSTAGPVWNEITEDSFDFSLQICFKGNTNEIIHVDRIQNPKKSGNAKKQNVASEEVDEVVPQKKGRPVTKASVGKNKTNKVGRNLNKQCQKNLTFGLIPIEEPMPSTSGYPARASKSKAIENIMSGRNDASSSNEEQIDNDFDDPMTDDDQSTLQVANRILSTSYEKATVREPKTSSSEESDGDDAEDVAKPLGDEAGKSGMNIEIVHPEAQEEVYSEEEPRSGLIVNPRPQADAYNEEEPRNDMNPEPQEEAYDEEEPRNDVNPEPPEVAIDKEARSSGMNVDKRQGGLNKQPPRKIARKIATKTVASSKFRKPTERKVKPGAKALRDIKKLQRSTNFLMRRSPFFRLVREIALGLKECRFNKVALDVIQSAVEAFITQLFDDVQLGAFHGNRKTIKIKDLHLAIRLRSDLDTAEYQRALSEVHPMYKQKKLPNPDNYRLDRDKK